MTQSFIALMITRKFRWQNCQQISHRIRKLWESQGLIVILSSWSSCKPVLKISGEFLRLQSGAGVREMDQGFSRWAQRHCPCETSRIPCQFDKNLGIYHGIFMMYPHFLAIQHHGAHETWFSTTQPVDCGGTLWSSNMAKKSPMSSWFFQQTSNCNWFFQCLPIFSCDFLVTFPFPWPFIVDFPTKTSIKQFFPEFSYDFPMIFPCFHRISQPTLDAVAMSPKLQGPHIAGSPLQPLTVVLQFFPEGHAGACGLGNFMGCRWKNG